MKIFTIGFTKKNAEKFFNLINKSNVKLLIDVRLNNSSQLAGFAKKDDLKYFLKHLCNTEYLHMPELTPTKDILDKYKKSEITWDQYKEDYLNLLSKRKIENHINPNLLDHCCFLCSEHEPDHCHRRLIVEYLEKMSNIDLSVKHLM